MSPVLISCAHLRAGRGQPGSQHMARASCIAQPLRDFATHTIRVPQEQSVRLGSKRVPVAHVWHGGPTAHPER